jgi:hypothetical protein
MCRQLTASDRLSGIGFFFAEAAIKPSRCACFRASLRALLIASPFSRVVFADVFS